MKFKRYTVDSPEVKAVLSGVWKSGTGSYYRIVDGKHVACRIKQELIALGMCATIASRLLQAADLPVAPFIHNRTPNKPKPKPERPLEVEIEAEIEVYELASPVEAIATVEAMPTGIAAILTPTEPKPLKKTGPKPLTEEEREAKLAKAAQVANARRWQLISTNSGKWGIWDGDSGSVIAVYLTKDEAVEELNKLRSGGKSYHWYKTTAAAAVGQEIHY